MKKHSDEIPDWEAQRNKIIGLGETSIRKSYYPELQQRIQELEKKNRELQEAYADQTAFEEELRQQFDETLKKEQELKESEAFLSSIVENLPLMLFVKDATDLRFVRFNRAGEELLGHTREEMIGKSDYDFFSQEVADYFTGKDREALQNTEPMDIPEEKIATRLRGERILHTRKIPIRSESGRPKFLLGLSEDITEKRLAESALRDSERRFTLFMENIPAAVYIKDWDGNLVFSNRYLNELLGWSDPLGRSTFDLLPREVAQAMVEADHGAASQGSLSVLESLTDTSGRKRIFSTTKFALPEPSGHPLLGGISLDITERKAAEEALKVSEERYRSLVDITDTGYLVLDDQGRVLDANEVYLRLTGRASMDEIVGRSAIEWTAPHDMERNAREMESCVTNGYIRGLEIDYLKPDGTIQPVEINATMFKGGSGTVILTICRDIADRRRINVALQQARNKLTLLNAVTFQDIQTAAFSLSAYQELIKTIIVDSKAKTYLEKQELFLKKMVETLDFAKNYQEMGIHPARWQNVRQVFLYAISHLDFLKIKQDIRFENLEIFADPLLEKALFNIMENVLHHGVHATEVRLFSTEGPDGLHLIIEDNGVGIPVEEKHMIFDRGYGRGSGLGLFLVREVLSITGMIIKETGTAGRGTRFEILVPNGAYRVSSSP